VKRSLDLLLAFASTENTVVVLTCEWKESTSVIWWVDLAAVDKRKFMGKFEYGGR